MNKLRNRAIRTTVMLLAVVIFAVLITVYVNSTATSGHEFDVSLHVTSGDPAVLAEM